MTCIGRTRRIVLFWVAAALIASVEAVLTAGWLVGKTSSRIYSSVNDIPARKVGMVLGAPEYSGNRPNPVLAGRLRAAVEADFDIMAGGSQEDESYCRRTDEGSGSP